MISLMAMKVMISLSEEKEMIYSLVAKEMTSFWVVKVKISSSEIRAMIL